MYTAERYKDERQPKGQVQEAILSFDLAMSELSRLDMELRHAVAMSNLYRQGSEPYLNHLNAVLDTTYGWQDALRTVIDRSIYLHSAHEMAAEKANEIDSDKDDVVA